MTAPLTRPWDHIPGWFDFEDIYQQAIDTAPDGAFLVEIGCWLGKSSRCLLELARRSGKNLHLVFVDTWLGTPDDHHQQGWLRDTGKDPFKEWIANMGGTDAVYDDEGPVRITPLQRSSTAAAGLFFDKGFHFIFIDAAHDYASVRSDILAWLPKLKPTGIMAGHDYLTPDVARAVNELLPTAVQRNTSWLLPPA